MIDYEDELENVLLDCCYFLRRIVQVNKPWRELSYMSRIEGCRNLAVGAPETTFVLLLQWYA